MLAVRVDASAEGVPALEGPAVAGGDTDAQALVRSEREHLRPALACDLGRSVGRPVVDNEDVRVGQPLVQTLQDRGQVLLLVPGGDEDERAAHRRLRSSSARAACSCNGRNGSASSSQATARRVGARRATRKATSTPEPRYRRLKSSCVRRRCGGAQTTTASPTSRSSNSGRVRAAFSAVDAAVGSTTSSTAGPRHASRICSASEGPPVGDQPLKTTTSASVLLTSCSASRTSRRQRSLIRCTPAKSGQPWPGTTTAVRFPAIPSQSSLRGHRWTAGSGTGAGSAGNA